MEQAVTERSVLRNLRRIVEETTTWGGRLFDLIVQGMILLSLISFSIETLPDLRPEVTWTLREIEAVFVAFFTAEYVLRILVAERPLRYVFSFFGIVDLLSILPFYLTARFDLVALRTLRLLRVFRALKFFRYHRAFERYVRAYHLVQAELFLFFTWILVLLFLTAVGIYHFEHPVQPEAFKSIFHSLWWAVSALTTLSYGEIYPVTAGGRIFTFFVLCFGLAVVAIPSGLIASALSEVRRLEREEASRGTGAPSSGSGESCGPS